MSHGYNEFLKTCSYVSETVEDEFFSAERIVRALSTSCCLYNSLKDEVIVLRNESIKKFKFKTNKKSETYNT